MRAPGRVPLVAVGILAVALGAATTVFSLLNAVLLRPLPYLSGEQMMVLWEQRPKDGTRTNGVAPADYLDWLRQSRSFTSLTAHDQAAYTLAAGGEAERLRATQVTPNFLDSYGVQVAMGRGFRDEDVLAGGRVALLADGVWRTRYGADRQAVGRTMVLDNQPYTIVGVMPPDFRIYFGRDTDIFVPLVRPETVWADRGSHDFLVVGRLRPGVTRAEAQAELDGISRALERQWPSTNTGHSAYLVPIEEQLRKDVKPLLGMLAGAVGLVLLTACANVANLLLARGLARHREFAIRQSLGATPWSLLRMLLGESVVMGVAAGALGLWLAWVSMGLVVKMAPRMLAAGQVAGLERVQIDWRVVLFSFVLAIVPALAVGLVPWPVLRKGTPDTRRNGSRRAGEALLVTETALASLLLVGAALLMTSFERLMRVDPGFLTDGRISFTLPLGAGYGGLERQRAVFPQLLERIQNIPGVRHSALTTYVPGNMFGWRWAVRREGEPPPPSIQDALRIYMRVVTDDFAVTMGIPVLRGRGFKETDIPDGEPVVLLSQAAVDRYFAGRDVVGKRVALGDQTIWRTVVGVVGSVREVGLDRVPEPEIYLPLRQFDWTWPSISVVMETRAGFALGEVRRAVADVAPGVAVTDVARITHLLEESGTPHRFHAAVVGVFAVLALLLAAAGAYSVIAYWVGSQTRDIGIRMALGARPVDVLNGYLQRSLGLVGLGLLFGLAGAAALGRLMASFLYATSPWDAGLYAAAAALLLVTGVAATWGPAWRASRVEPASVLHGD